jgi:hypothetical protein
VGLERGPLNPCEDKCGATRKKNSGSGLENCNDREGSAALTTRQPSIHESWH